MIYQAAPVSNFFGDLMTSVDGYLQAFMTAGVAGVQGPILGTVAAVGGLYFALQGWMIMYGHSDGSMINIFKGIFKMMLIYAVATSALFYGTWIVDFFWQLPEAIGKIIIRTAADVSGTTIDTTTAGQIDNDISGLMATYQESVTDITERIAKSGRVVPDVIAAILNVLMQIPLVAALFIVIIAKVGLAVMIVLGPFALLCLLFGWSKGIFEGWLRQSLTFILTSVLAYTVIALLVSLLNTAANNLGTPTGSLEWMEGVPVAILAVICGIVFSNVPSFSAGLVGGIAMSTGGAGGAATAMAGKGAGAAASMVGKGSKAAGGRVGRAIGRNAAPVAESARKGASKLTAKLPPRVQNQLTRGKEKVKTSAQSVKKGAQSADYYTGGKSAIKPSVRAEAQAAKAKEAAKPKTPTAQSQENAARRARWANIKPPQRPKS